MWPYIHCGVDLSNSLIIQGELVDLDPIADQFTHDFDLELVQLSLADGVSFGNHWDDVHLQQQGIHLHLHVQNHFGVICDTDFILKGKNLIYCSSMN